MNISHTPLPWAIHKKYDEDIVSADGKTIIARVLYNLYKIPTTNAIRQQVTVDAAHIVRCVNCHDDLLEALQAMVEAFDKHDNCSDLKTTRPVRAVARAAIAKAVQS